MNMRRSIDTYSIVDFLQRACITACAILPGHRWSAVPSLITESFRFSAVTGMGVVYRAEDIRLGREVALKFLPDHLASDPLALERFRREARAASRINHPHICTVYDIGEDEQGHPFLVMELLEGETLKYRLQRGPVSLPELLDWGSQIADALEQRTTPESFIATLNPRTSSSLHGTSEGSRLWSGKGSCDAPRDAATAQRGHRNSRRRFPDQSGTHRRHRRVHVARAGPWRGAGPANRLFSTGVVLYEMATGQVPFAGNTSAVIFDAILNREPSSVVERNRLLPIELGHISKAIEKDRKLRYQSAAELRADLQRLKRDGSTDRRPGAVAAPHRRSRAWLALAVSVLLIVAVAGAAFFLRRPPVRTIQELVPTRVTSNNSDAAIQTMALLPDGKYIAYSDSNGVHVRSKY
jgi:eukaryotic-like serine/threonine-protein kinase